MKMPGLFILDDDGEPVRVEDLAAWGTWMASHDAIRVVARTHPVPGVRVSTVFLGLDHNFGFDQSPPILWETMLFVAKPHALAGLDLEQWRYPSRQAALQGHAAAVQLVRAEAALHLPAPQEHPHE